MSKVEKIKGSTGAWIIKNPLPDDPSNLRISKKQFIEKERIRRENEIKIAEFTDSLKTDKNDVVNQTIVNNKSQETPKRGRPKKIEWTLR